MKNVENIEKAKYLFCKTDVKPSLVLVKGNEVLTSFASGIKPLLNYLNEGYDLNGYALADKIVGKAQALLCIKAGIQEVYAEVLSESGKKILEKHNIPYQYEILTEKIINRKGDDICPMEKAVLKINDPEKAFVALNKTIIQLSKLS